MTTKERLIRTKYLTAMGTALGGNSLLVEIATSGLLEKRDKLAEVNYSSLQRGEQPSAHLIIIELVGKMFLSEGRQSLKFTVGCTILSLLREPVDSGYFSNLRDRVDYWTDGSGGIIFETALKKKL